MVRNIASAVLAVTLIWAGTAFAAWLTEADRQGHERRVAWCSQVWYSLPPGTQEELRTRGGLAQSMPWGNQGGLVPFLIETDHPVRFTQYVQTWWLDIRVMEMYQTDLARALGKHQYMQDDHFLLGPPCMIVLVDDSGLNGEIYGKAGLHDPDTGVIFLNVDLHQNHEDMMVTLFHEFVHHYLDKVGVPSGDHHAIMCKHAEDLFTISTTGYREQVCDPNIGF